MKESIRIISTGFILACGIWVSITTTVQMFKCPKMTQTELFIHIPQSFIMDFTETIK